MSWKLLGAALLMGGPMADGANAVNAALHRRAPETPTDAFLQHLSKKWRYVLLWPRLVANKTGMTVRSLRIIGLVLGLLAFQVPGEHAYAETPVAPAIKPPALGPAATTTAAQRAPRKAGPMGPALWKVADKDTTIYLFGTIHALPKNIDWYTPTVAHALESSDELVTEVDLEGPDLPSLIKQKALLPDGQNLRDTLGPEDRKDLEEAMISVGLPVQAFDNYKPWYAAITLSLIPLLNAGYDTDSGVEEVLAQHFGQGKPRGHLETLEFQLDLFDKLPIETQRKYLGEVVKSVPSLTQQLDAMLDQWLEGDANQLAKLINAQETDPTVYKRLIAERNANWAGWIQDRLKRPGVVFIAVGAGHLAGRGNVQEQLRRHGIKSVRVR